MAARSVPARIQWAVDLLDVGADDRILEVGCGNGVAAGVVCDALAGSGRMTAIDRSATAISRARQRNAHHVESGRLLLEHADLTGFSGSGPPFDQAFAVNVNVFWAAEATAEIERLGQVLRLGGRLILVYEAPDPDRMRHELAPRIATRLAVVGFDTDIETLGDLCAIVGTKSGDDSHL